MTRALRHTRAMSNTAVHESSFSAVQIVRDIYAAFGRGDIPFILERLSPDVDWDYGYPERGVPYLTPRKGRDGAATFFASLSGLEFRKFEVTHVMGDGPLVVALAQTHLIVKATGREIVEDCEVHLWHFDAAGRISRFRHVVDTLQHVEAHRATASSST